MIRPLWIEIDLKTLGKNFRVIRSYLGRNIKTIVTIKQSAYGHGLIPIAKKLYQEGADYFGVGSIEEAITLRKEGLRSPIIVLTAVLDRFCSLFLRYKIIPTIVDLRFAQELNRQAAKRKCLAVAHVKIDTGMGRLGFYYKDAYAFLKELSKLKNISLEGIYTHFPVADTDPDFTNYQIDAFNCFIQRLESKKIFFKFHHCANSIGIIRYPNAHFNMVRPGLILYGIKPSCNLKINTKPILSLKSKVIFTKRIRKGMSIGYGRTYIAKSARNIGTVSIGYADGYPWALSNRARVIINNNFFKVVGRICMDHIMVDLKNREDISVGKEVVLIGKSKDKIISVEDLAQWAQTIPYEIVSRLSPKIPRIYSE